MSFWERNTFIALLGSILGGTFYFGLVVYQSFLAGGVVMPALWVWLGYIVFQLIVSLIGTALFNRRHRQEVKDIRGGQDERDRIIQGKSESWQGHIMSFLIFVSLALWFVHQSPALLFHSVIAALILSEIARGFIQLSKYNRAV